MKKPVLILLFLIIIIPGKTISADPLLRFTTKTIIAIKKELQNFGSSDSLKHSPNMKSYFSHYGIAATGTKHYFGAFNWQDIKLAAHLYRPGQCRGTVFIIHGYLNHGALLQHPIKHAIKKGYAVATFDLQGHGFSDGKRADIKDFAHYASGLKSFIQECKGMAPEPFYGMGHSTGCSVFLEFIRTNKNRFKKLIFAAPLVRSGSWRLSQIGHAIASPFISTVPRIFKRTSSDLKFLEFLEHRDFLQARKIPLSWADALFRWNSKLKNIPISTTGFAVIQGTEDRVVDWQYNIKFLKNKFPNSEVLIIKGARHELFNESEKYRQKVFAFIDRHIP